MEIKSTFEARGFVGPLPVLTEKECMEVLRFAQRSPPPPYWPKGNAVAYPGYYQIACMPRLLPYLTELLGPDVMVWGASVVRRPAGSIHAWHCDCETADSTAKAVSVWIGLEHSGVDTALRLMSHSHRFGQSVQEIEHLEGGDGCQIDEDELLAIARARDSRCAIECPPVRDGEAILFDGRIWHGARNARDDADRAALLLQYATPDTQIRIPDFSAPAGRSAFARLRRPALWFRAVTPSVPTDSPPPLNSTRKRQHDPCRNHRRPLAVLDMPTHDQ